MKALQEDRKCDSKPSQDDLNLPLTKNMESAGHKELFQENNQFLQESRKLHLLIYDEKEHHLLYYLKNSSSMNGLHQEA